MSDLIERQAAIDSMTNTLWHYPNECYRNLNEYEFAKGLSELGLKSVPSAQPYTEADIQKMQDLEQAELDKAYECGRASAQPEQRWIPVIESMPEESGRYFAIAIEKENGKEVYGIVEYHALTHQFIAWDSMTIIAWYPIPDRRRIQEMSNK